MISIPKSFAKLSILTALIGFSPSSTAQAQGIDLGTTGTIQRIQLAQSNVSPTSGTLRNGLDALSSKDTNRALAIRAGMRPGSLDRKILAWAIAISPSSRPRAGDIAKIANDLPNWPGHGAMTSNFERALVRAKASDSQIIRALGGRMPKSSTGKVALARAYMRSGQGNRAAAIIRPWWHKTKLKVAEQRKYANMFAPILRKADHKRRMDAMLYYDRPKAAGALAPLANAESLARGRTAVIRKAKNASAALDAVHPSLKRDAGYLFSRIKLNRRNDNYVQAARLLLNAPRDPNVLVNPDEWWVERRIVGRAMLDQGDARTAYSIVAGHSATGRKSRVDAEFHAGWIALRYLGDARRAQRHFANILQISTQPLSVSRANYWLGRTAQAAGNNGNARAYYQRAAALPATFYGQLSVAKLGGGKLNLRRKRASGSDRANFNNRELVRAIKALESAGYGWRADIIYRHLARKLTSAGEIALLSLRAENRGDYNLVLQVGKLAYTRGLPVDTLAFPLGAIPKSANISAVGKALAYAIARQESAFRPTAVSGAGARGLLQLLPGTAKGVAKRNGLPYSKAALTKNPGLNATLGAAYLAEQRAKFNGSYVLTFAAYNAGPRRATQWIAKCGDPRGRSVEEVVDWIERLPFTETRNYVMRIMENYQVYKTRIAGGSLKIESDLRAG